MQYKTISNDEWNALNLNQNKIVKTYNDELIWDGWLYFGGLHGLLWTERETL